MSFLDDLPALDRQPRRSCPKPQPRQLTKKREDKAKADQGKAFRDEVWARDQGKCRATKQPLLRTGSTDWTKLGEVDHSILRSLAPERIYDTSNGLLLRKDLNRLRKVACPQAPEHRMFEYSGPDNRALPQRFVWRDATGKIVRKEIG